MTYRELLKLYKQGKLEDSTKKQIEAEIEKQDAISEFLYEEGAIPDFSDLESGQDYFDDLNDKKQWTERQNSKTEDNVEKQSENRIIEKSKSAGDSRNQQEDEFNRQFIKEIQRFIRRAFIKMGLAGWMEYSGQEGLFRQAGTAGWCGSFGSKQYFQGRITVFCVNFSFKLTDIFR